MSIFEKIANREIDAFIIWEDESFCAFLDINPLTEGHTLVVPKKNPGDYIFKMDIIKYTNLMTACYTVANLISEKIECSRVLMSVEGFAVPHVHVHLIPAKEGFDLNSAKPIKLTQEELKATYRKFKV